METSQFLTQSKWYRGDFHAHTTASWDGYHTLAELAAVARAEKLDFFAVTDHNSVAALAEIADISGILVLPGIEVTTKRGHLNVFGMAGELDWMDGLLGDEEWATLRGKYTSATALTRYTAELGLLNSINHPLMTPWAWQFADVEMGYIHAIEIWNDPSYPTNDAFNPQTLDLWTRALNAGLRVTGIGGSDYHRPQPLPGMDKPPDRLGTPVTYVFAPKLSVPAILTAVREHRAVVSMGATVGFLAWNGTQVFGIGESLSTGGETVTFHAAVFSSPQAAQARLVKNGEIVAVAAVDTFPAKIEWPQPAHSIAPTDWFRLDVFSADGDMLAVTNPIFGGAAPSPRGITFADL